MTNLDQMLDPKTNNKIAILVVFMGKFGSKKIWAKTLNPNPQNKKPHNFPLSSCLSVRPSVCAASRRQRLAIALSSYSHPLVSNLTFFFSFSCRCSFFFFFFFHLWQLTNNFFTNVTRNKNPTRLEIQTAYFGFSCSLCLCLFLSINHLDLMDCIRVWLGVCRNKQELFYGNNFIARICDTRQRRWRSSWRNLIIQGPRSFLHFQSYCCCCSSKMLELEDVVCYLNFSFGLSCTELGFGSLSFSFLLFLVAL